MIESNEDVDKRPLRIALNKNWTNYDWDFSGSFGWEVLNLVKLILINMYIFSQYYILKISLIVYAN